MSPPASRSGRNELGKRERMAGSVPSPDASAFARRLRRDKPLGDGDGAARRPYQNCRVVTGHFPRPVFCRYRPLMPPTIKVAVLGAGSLGKEHVRIYAEL